MSQLFARLFYRHLSTTCYQTNTFHLKTPPFDNLRPICTYHFYHQLYYFPLKLFLLPFYSTSSCPLLQIPNLISAVVSTLFNLHLSTLISLFPHSFTHHSSTPGITTFLHPLPSCPSFSHNLSPNLCQSCLS